MAKAYPIRNLIGSVFNQFKRDLQNVSLDKSVFSLIALQAVFFFYHIFVTNDIGLSVLSAMKSGPQPAVDHALMLDSMMSILSSSGFFNMNEGPHSAYYGWTYFFISFLFLAPLKLIVWCFGIESYLPVFIGLKILHFFYGLLCTISFYYLARKFFNEACSFVLATVAMLGTALTIYNYFFHPETMGILLLNLSCIYLINFIRSGDLSKKDLSNKYFTTLLLLILCTLCKATFLLVTLPVYMGLLITYWHKSGRGLRDIITNNDFIKIILKTTAFSFGVFFIIHPFFFIQLKKSIGKQIYNTSAHSNASMAVDNWYLSLRAWGGQLWADPLLAFTLAALVISIAYSLITFMKKNFEGRLTVLLLITVLINAVFTMSYFKLFISTSYLTPIMPFLMINAMAVLLFIGKKIIFKPMHHTAFAVILVLALAAPQIYYNIYNLYDFYNYKQQPQYQVSNYIETQIPDGALIMHDHFVGIPENKRIMSYHYWQVPLEKLRNDPADYIIFDPNFKHNDKYQEGTKIFRERIQSSKFEFIEKFDKLEIWKRK